MKMLSTSATTVRNLAHPDQHTHLFRESRYLRIIPKFGLNTGAFFIVAISLIAACN